MASDIIKDLINGKRQSKKNTNNDCKISNMLNTITIYERLNEKKINDNELKLQIIYLNELLNNYKDNNKKLSKNDILSFNKFQEDAENKLININNIILNNISKSLK